MGLEVWTAEQTEGFKPPSHEDLYFRSKSNPERTKYNAGRNVA